MVVERRTGKSARDLSGNIHGTRLGLACGGASDGGGFLEFQILVATGERIVMAGDDGTSSFGGSVTAGRAENFFIFATLRSGNICGYGGKTQRGRPLAKCSGRRAAAGMADAV